MRWTDERLKWDSDTLEVTVVDQKLIWLPYLRQFFAKDKDDIFEGQSRQIKIFSNGTDKGAKMTKIASYYLKVFKVMFLQLKMCLAP